MSKWEKSAQNMNADAVKTRPRFVSSMEKGERRMDDLVLYDAGASSPLRGDPFRPEEEGAA